VRKPVNRATSVGAAVVAGAVDLLLVLVFVLIGRASHNEASPVLGTLTTFWPFLVGLAVGWIGARAWRSPRRIVFTGVIVWAGTLIVGMLLRVVSGQGIQLTFVIVAAIVLAAFLIGWRALSILVVRMVRGS
jgi:peptidoglycan/LPS O-acetylase OafA/YrhL